MEDVKENTFIAAVFSYCQGKIVIYFSLFFKTILQCQQLHLRDFHWLTIASVFAISSQET